MTTYDAAHGDAADRTTDRRADGGVDPGLVTVESDADVPTTVDRITDAIAANDALSLMTTVDHAANAATAGLDLPPTTVLVFGNPALGTPLVRASAGRSLAIDLPQKLLVTATGDGTARITYNDPSYLADRHGIDGEAERLETVAGALASLAAAGAGGDADGNADD